MFKKILYMGVSRINSYMLLIWLLINTSYAAPTVLNVGYKDITVNGKTARVETITQNDGTWGYYGNVGESFNVIVKNNLADSTVIHWHGLFLPNDQDGTELTQKFIPSGKSYHYNFKLTQAGTFWMHSHAGLQEQDLLAAPLIIENKEDEGYQQIVMLLQDFSFKKPEQILDGLQHPKMSDMDMSNMKGMDMSKMAPDLNDVKYDDFLTNYHSDESPEIMYVKPGQPVKLRIINGSSMTNFWLNIDKIKGTVIAIDGNPITAYTNNLLQLNIASRMDVVFTMPKIATTIPVLGQVEGTKYQTGIILTNQQNMSKAAIPTEAVKAMPAFNYDQELKLHALHNLTPRPINKVINLELGGNMSKYTWSINKQMWPNVAPLIVKKGERVEIVFHNNTMMEHPMHLHGNVFQVIDINGQKINGTLRDTINIMPKSTVKVILDASTPGKWFLHCHMLYHMHTGMATFLIIK